MKKLFISILLIILLISISGCGLFNLDGWVIPDDTKFLVLIQELDTPEKIGDYMLDNFESEEHPYISLTPYQLYITKKGDCNDFATFAIYIAHFHGYETYQILMLFPKPIYPIDTWHAIPIFKEGNYYTFSENQWYFNQCHNSFADIMQIYNGWTIYKVYDYDMNIVEQVTK
jgi:hypothetical protein